MVAAETDLKMVDVQKVVDSLRNILNSEVLGKGSQLRLKDIGLHDNFY